MLVHRSPEMVTLQFLCGLVGKCNSLNGLATQFVATHISTLLAVAICCQLSRGTSFIAAAEFLRTEVTFHSWLLKGYFFLHYGWCIGHTSQFAFDAVAVSMKTAVAVSMKTAVAILYSLGLKA
jgi:hypothetical protein